MKKGPHVRLSSKAHEKLAVISKEFGLPMSQAIERLLEEKEERMVFLSKARMKIIDAIEEGRVRIVYNEPE